MGEIVREFRSSIEAGDAIETRPGTGEQAPGGSEITLVISNAIKVPDVEGMSAEKARQALRAAGLNPVDGESVDDSSVSLGDIAKQSPAAGELVNPAADTNVSIHASDSVRVPFMIGKSAESVSRDLEKLGVEVEISGPSDGRVYSQSPSAGTRIRAGDTVKLKTL